MSASLLLLLPLALLPTGCKHIRPQKEMVYVSARESYLRDRVAEVSNRVGKVTNGEPLEVLEHGRRFLKVKTPDGKIGWIEEHMIIDQQDYDTFAKLAADHKNDQPFASATLRDDLYVHVLPGRESDHFYLLPGNTKVQLLERASVPKQGAGAPPSLARLAAAKAPAKKTDSKGKASAETAPEPPPPPPVMEDWWLARDSQGRTGWLLASRVDVDVPDAILEYGEGQRFVGAWKLATVNDPGTDPPDHAEYLTLMAPPKSGQPFDFDQVRVFTWSRIHHRYETGFRLHPIAGFLPVKIFTAPGPKGQGQVPAFSFVMAGDENVITDSQTGVMRPAHPRTIEYEMIETQVKRIGADTAPIDTKHKDGAEKAKKKPGRKPARRR